MMKYPSTNYYKPTNTITDLLGKSQTEISPNASELINSITTNAV